MVLVFVEYAERRHGMEVMDKGIFRGPPIKIDCDKIELEFTVFYVFMEHWLRHTVSLLTLLVQVVFIVWIVRRERVWKNLLLFSFSSTVSIQRLVSMSPILLLSHFEFYSRCHKNKANFELFWAQFSLYIDFFSYFFYFSSIFSMMLNILTRMKKIWLVIACALFSVVSSALSIERSHIKRNFFPSDFQYQVEGKRKAAERILTLFCHLFPINTVITWCWIIYRRSKIPNLTLSMGLLCMAILQIIQCLLYEFVVHYEYIPEECPDFLGFYKENFEIFACCPVVFLPIFVMITTVRAERKSVDEDL